MLFCLRGSWDDVATLDQYGDHTTTYLLLASLGDCTYNSYVVLAFLVADFQLKMVSVPIVGKITNRKCNDPGPGFFKLIGEFDK